MVVISNVTDRAFALSTHPFTLTFEALSDIQRKNY